MYSYLIGRERILVGTIVGVVSTSFFSFHCELLAVQESRRIIFSSLQREGQLIPFSKMYLFRDEARLAELVLKLLILITHVDKRARTH